MTMLQILTPNWYNNLFFYLSVLGLIAIVLLVIYYNNKIKRKDFQIRSIEQQHANQINSIRLEQAKKIENIQIEQVKHEDERNRLWMESEKETLHVLNGVSTLLDLTDKLGRIESDKIMNKLDELKDQINNWLLNNK